MFDHITMGSSAEASVALIIPAHNEESVIAGTIAGIPEGLFSFIIVADNGSTDRTADIARRHGASVVRIEERGYGAACLEALNVLPPHVNVVVFLQADGSEDPSQANLLLQPILSGQADLVLGSRTLGHAEPGALLPHQEFGNWVATTLIRWLYGFQYSDLGPFRAIRLGRLRALAMRERNYGWTVEMQVRAVEENLRILEVPIRYGRRVAGENKVSGKWKASLLAGWRILSTVVRLRLRKRP